jgi:nicotinamide-nucleotide amidase
MIGEIISIGDELLIGHVVNTNASWMSQALGKAGVPVRHVVTVGDDGDDIKAALETAMRRSDLVLLTGGLGPTHDDITKKVVAEFFDSPKMGRDEKVLAHVRELFSKRNAPMHPVNNDQALVPEKARILWNDVGTAPGLLFEREGKLCAVMPGVPAEMRHIMSERVIPLVEQRVNDSVIAHRTIRTAGIGESALFAKLEPIKDIEKFARIAFLPNYMSLDLRLSVRAPSRSEAASRIADAEKIVLDKAGEYVFGYDEDTIESVIGRRLVERRETLAIAESCTGGWVSNRITNVAGSSNYFERGVITYSNAAKTELLDVPEEILREHGAVSEATARAMAEGVRRVAKATYGLSTTGIAGPSGGTLEKPVGLVWIGLATPEKSLTKRFLYTQDRLVNKERFSQAALHMLYLHLANHSSNA